MGEGADFWGVMHTCLPLLVLGFFLTFCGPDDPTGPPSVARVEVIAPTQTLTALGQTVDLQAAAKTASGSAISGKTFTWQSSDDAVLTVTNTGVATAIGNGTATITASTDGLSGSLSVTVQQVPSQLAIRTLPDGAASGTPLTTQPVLEVQDANGNIVSIDNTTAVAASLGGNTSVTAAQGVASFVDLVVSGVVGERTFTFPVTGLPSVSSDGFDLVPGTPNTLSLAGGDRQTGVAGKALTDTIAVFATDDEGNPVSGYPIAWSVADGSGSITAVLDTTDDQGLGKAVWTVAAVDQTATAESALGTVTFTSAGTPDVPAVVALSPDPVELASLGADQQLSASV